MAEGYRIQAVTTRLLHKKYEPGLLESCQELSVTSAGVLGSFALSAMESPTVGHSFLLRVQLSQAETDMFWDDGTQNIEPVMDIYAAEHISLVRYALYL